MGSAIKSTGCSHREPTGPLMPTRTDCHPLSTPMEGSVSQVQISSPEIPPILSYHSRANKIKAASDSQLINQF